tara:strand:- start:401 stop:811 length:411 start_codon:yes stop_codon:yes gene_type:complete
MSTRSYIAIRAARDPDNKSQKEDIQMVYCHFDGYPSNNGQQLLDYYTTDEKVYDLIGLGDMSSLGRSLSQCEFYGRDRGEFGTNAQTFTCFNAFKKAANDVSYNYLFDCQDEQWYYRSCGDNDFSLLDYKSCAPRS